MYTCIHTVCHSFHVILVGLLVACIPRQQLHILSRLLVSCGKANAATDNGLILSGHPPSTPRAEHHYICTICLLESARSKSVGNCAVSASLHAGMTSVYQVTSAKQTSATPMFHNVYSLPFCDDCTAIEQDEYMLSCEGCQRIFKDPQTDVGKLFAICRTWEINIQQNMDRVVGQLLSRGVPVNDIDAVSGCSMIHFAAKCGARNFGDDEKAAVLVSHLILKGANPNERDAELHMTPLA